MIEEDEEEEIKEKEVEDEEIENEEESEKEKDGKKEEGKQNKIYSPYLFFDACKLKVESFLKSFLLSLLIYLIIGLCMERNYGLINFLAKTTNTNHFFLTLAIGIYFHLHYLLLS